jgi:hypothetical protein
MHVHATVIIIAHVDPLFNGKKKFKQGLTLLNLVFAGCMFIGGKERMRRLVSWSGKTPMLLFP